MPLYEYLCNKCGHRFERIQRFSDPMVKKCPECGGRVEQVISAPAVQFKGSGWYVTDYAKKPASGGPSTTGDSGSKAESERKSEQKSGSDGQSSSAAGSSGKDSGAKKDAKQKAGSSSGKSGRK